MNFLKRILTFLASSVLVMGSGGIIYRNFFSKWFWLFEALLVLLIFIALLFRKPHGITEINKRYLFIASLVVLALTQAGVVWSTFSKSDWDVRSIREAAEGYLAGNNFNKNYMTRYNNNMPITMFLVIIYKVANLINIDGFSLTMIVNAVCMIFASIVILYVVYREFSFRIYALAWIITFSLVGLSPYITTFYTDSIGLFAVAIVILLCSIFKDRKRGVIAFLLGLFLFFAVYIKITAIIPIIAYLAACLVFFRASFFEFIKSKSSLLILAGIVVGIAINGFLYDKMSGLKYNDPAMIDRYEFGFVHFLAMGSMRDGSDYDNCRKGGYCHPFVIDMIDTPTKEERKKKAMAIFNKNLKKDFPVGYVGFMIDKVSRSFSDGSFGVWVEANSKIINFIHKDRFSINSRKILADKNDIEGTAGLYMSRMKFFWDAIWNMALVAMIVFLLCGDESSYRGKDRLFFAFFIIGVALYQGVLESRSRYIFLYLPIFILMASSGIDIVAKKIKGDVDEKVDDCNS